MSTQSKQLMTASNPYLQQQLYWHLPDWRVQQHAEGCIQVLQQLLLVLSNLALRQQ